VATTTPKTLTIDEAVARIVNLDYIPEGFTLEEMLSAFQEEAEVNLEAAGPFSLEDDLEDMEIRLQACNARLAFAKSIQEALNNQIEDINLGKDSLIDISPDNGDQSRLTSESVAHWASEQYGIDIPEWRNSGETPANISWSDVTIKLKANNRITFSNKNGSYKSKTMLEIDLLNRTTNTLNNQGAILLGLAFGEKYPKGSSAEQKDKTAISKLRRSLVALTNIKDEPFFPFNSADGWKPKFNLIDDRSALDERAKEKAVHVEFKDDRPYTPEGDEADDYIARAEGRKR